MTLLRKKKGVSGIISGLFLVAVSMMIFSMSYWQIMQQDHYNQISLERAKRDSERYNERIVITEIGYAGFLRFNVTNIGGVTAHIVTIYLNDTEANIPGAFILANYICSNSSAWISPGAKRVIYTTIPFTRYHVYNLIVATERGNTAAAINNPTPPYSFKFGRTPFSFESTSFNYTTTSDGSPWNSISRPAWEMIGGKANILFWMKIQNHASVPIQISKLSYLMVVRPHDDTTEDEFYFFIVDPASISGTGPPAVIAYADYSQEIPCNPQDPDAGGTPTLVKFGANQPGGTTLISMPSPVTGYSSQRKYVYTSYIILYWRWGGTAQYYGLVVPFAAIHVLSP